MNIRSILPIIVIVLIAGFLTGCGSEWDDIAKKGNTWEYELSEGSNSTTVTAEVVNTYKVGDKKFAEVIPNKEENASRTLLYGWDDEEKALTYAGRSPQLDQDNSKTQFFVKETTMGRLENEEDKTIKRPDGTVVEYIGEKEIEVPAGKFETLLFEHKNDSSDKYWYSKGKGFVQIKSPEGTLKLKKFTEGEDKSVELGDEENAEAGFQLVKDFYTTALEKGSGALKSLMTDAGSKSVNSAGLKLLADRIKSHKKPEIATVSFLGPNQFNLRFRVYVESGGEPNVLRTDVTLHLVKGEEEMKVNKIKVKYTKLVQ